MNKIFIGVVILIIGTILFKFYYNDYNRANSAYENGDFHKAIQLYEKACDDNNMDACRIAGYCYDEGLGKRLNLQKAIQLYSKACDGEDMVACHNLAMMYLEGRGVKKDGKRAFEMFGTLCDNGLDIGCYSYNELKERIMLMRKIRNKK
ncbi:tetratricopeptide repeat protein [Sulfurimonas sp.]|uniref:tetratricopeptide repeat protein n=1 Tax=Sulfurimonas sp. TaxID=2022749 RepID=UPI002AB11519|nr:tetratricopeptide repeat protein [Sulfurimonas sp.]